MGVAGILVGPAELRRVHAGKNCSPFITLMRLVLYSIMVTFVVRED